MIVVVSEKQYCQTTKAQSLQAPVGGATVFQHDSRNVTTIIFQPVHAHALAS